MDLDNAIKAHAEWKVKLRAAIASKAPMDQRVVAADNECPLGKWLHGEGKARYGNHEKFGPCVQKHAAFHRAAGMVAAQINAGKFEEAETMLNTGTPYMTASNEAGTAIMSLKRALG